MEETVNKVPNNQKRSSLTLGTIISYVAILVEIVAGLVYVPWMVNQLGESNYSIYSLAASITAIFTIDFGLSASASKFISKYRSQGDEESANKYSTMIYKMFLFLDGVIMVAFVVFLFIMGLIYKSFTPEQLKQLEIVFAIIGVYTILIFPMQPNGCVYIGNDRYVFSKIINLATKLITIGLIVFGLLRGMSLYGFVMINCGVTIVSRILSTIYLRTSKNLYGNKFLWKFWDKQIFKDILSYCIWQGTCIIMEKLIVYSVPSILGMFSGKDYATAQIAAYQLGLTIDTYVMTFATALNGMFITRLTSMKTNHKSPEEFTNYWIKVGRIQLIFVAVVVIGFFAIGKDFVNVWLRANDSIKDPNLVFYVSILLVAPEIIICTQQIGNTLLIVEDKYKYRALIYAITCVLSIALTCILVVFIENKAIGCILAALATCIARTIGLGLGSVIIFKKQLKLNVKKFYIKTYLVNILQFLVVFALGFGINLLLPSNSYLYILIKAVIISVIYLIVVWLFVLNKFEKEYLFASIKKLFHKKG